MLMSQDLRAGTLDRTGDEPMAARQAQVEQILHLGRHLRLDQRSLLESVYQRGVSPAALARAAGQDPGVIRRRLKKIIARIGSPEFRFVVGQMHRGPDARQAIAREVLLCGRSQRAAASTLGISVHRVRRELDRIRIMRETTQQHGR